MGNLVIKIINVDKNYDTELKEELMEQNYFIETDDNIRVTCKRIQKPDK